ERLQSLFGALPDCFHLYTVRNQQNELMAALVTITVTPQAVYSFLPAFDRKYSLLSPLALLFYELMGHLKVKGHKILDLGISSIDGSPQSGLIKFKESLGGIGTRRMTYILNHP